MDCHPVLDHFFGRVSILPPQKTKQVSIFFSYIELVKHTLNVSHEGHFFLTESAQDSQKTIGQVWTLQKMIIKADTFELG